MKNTKRITLELYVSVLKDAADASLKHPHEHEQGDIRRRALKELMNAGLLSDARYMLGHTSFVDEIVLTPNGASALVEWSDYLKQQTTWHKAGKAFAQLIWVVVGAVAATIPQLLTAAGS